MLFRSEIDPNSLEQRIEELANNGRIEYKIYVAPNPENENGESLGKMISSDFSGLTQTCVAQAKMMDEWIQQVEIIKRERLKKSLDKGNDIIKTLDDYKDKYRMVNKQFKEVTKQKKDLENKINNILAIEDIVNRRFEELIQVVEELIENSPSVNAVELSTKIDELKKQWNYKQEQAKAFHPSKKDREVPNLLDAIELNKHKEMEELIADPVGEPEFTSFEDIYNETKKQLEVG